MKCGKQYSALQDDMLLGGNILMNFTITRMSYCYAALNLGPVGGLLIYDGGNV